MPFRHLLPWLLEFLTNVNLHARNGYSAPIVTSKVTLSSDVLKQIPIYRFVLTNVSQGILKINAISFTGTHLHTKPISHPNLRQIKLILSRTRSPMDHLLLKSSTATSLLCSIKLPLNPQQLWTMCKLALLTLTRFPYMVFLIPTPPTHTTKSLTSILHGYMDTWHRCYRSYDLYPSPLHS